MLISKFDSLHDNEPKSESISWSDFVARYSKHIVVSRKEAAPTISPAEWVPGAKRKKADVVRVHFAALDLDGVERDVVIKLKKLLEPNSYLMYTTWSHIQSRNESGLYHFRVFIELSRPVDIAEWPRFWAGLNTYVGGFMDESCKDAGRIYFVPATPRNSTDNRVHSQIREPLNVEEMLSLVTKREPSAKINNAAAQVVTREAMMALARGLRARTNSHQQKLGVCLKKVLDKESFADAGERDSILFQLAGLVAEQWPHADPVSLAMFFKGSLLEMSTLAPDAPTLEDAVEKIARKQSEYKSAAQSQDDSEYLKARVMEAFSGQRSHGYTEEEVTQFAFDANVPPEIFRQRWIIDCAGSNYLFVNGDYMPPVATKSLVTALLTALSPAHTVGVHVENVSARGKRVLKTEKELYRDYGTSAVKVLADMSAQKSSYDWTTRIFTEAVCPMRKLTPAFSENVDRYLRTLGGEFQQNLLDWVATITKLGSPTAGLYLHGVRGAGKSLLAHGLARIWKMGGATELVDVVDAFNESLADCPIVLADEHLPRILKKEGSSADLRSFIQARTRPLRRKFKGPAEIVGAARLIMKANNMNLIRNEHMSAEDVDALQDRILYIYAGEESQAFLATLSHAERDAFVQGDEIAKHALWLRDNREVQIGSRFLVSGNDSSFHRFLATSTGIRSALCNWLTSYLLNPPQLDSLGHLPVRIYEGELLVNVRAVTAGWELYKTNVRPPASSLISSALKGISSTKKQLPDVKTRRPTNYWRVRTDLLISWNQETDFATREEILAALDTSTEDRGVQQFHCRAA